MSNKREMSFRSSLRVTLDLCKWAKNKYLRWTKRATLSTVDDRANEQFEIGSLTKIKGRLHVDLGSHRMEFERFCQSLSIGDRIRVLCDDGVLVAEKISPTQFRPIHSQAMSQFTH